ncbi:MAG: translation initiation factor IF-1 [Verrucomicrobia bacterium]|nr:translation initiation factor IF-1 [Verrucomicrobiota bacterium]
MDLPPATERSPRRPVRAWGRIESLLPGHRCTVLMPNGFRAEAHPDKSCRADPPVLVVGDPVYLEFSTYDLSNPRIIPPDREE